MNTATIITIETVLSADRSISKVKREQVMDILLDRGPPRIPHKKEQVTPTQAAELIGISTATLRRYVKSGIISEIRVSDRKVRYDLREIIMFANGDRNNTG